jgi:murein DD-endopeptidase MepM/ murein hydrolase activator NlpD
MKSLLIGLLFLMGGSVFTQSALASINLIWPSNGQILSKFDSNKKGIQIAGVLGTPVVAAANGRVVYAGNTLKGYGNLIILKHDNTYLTTYAHNSKLLVKEGDTVRQGEKIAELGATDSTEPKLQFEVRENGKPVDPELFLNRQLVAERLQDKNEISGYVVTSQQDEK